MNIYFDDFYELDMCLLTWTQIQTLTPTPGRKSACSLNVTRENQLVLHGGDNHDDEDDILEDTWVMDLSSYSWKCTNIYSYRSYHTGTLGINNSIIIIGGFYTKDINNFMLEPKSLLQISIMTVYKYRGQLPCKCLPKKLIKFMQHGSKDDTTDAQDSPPGAD